MELSDIPRTAVFVSPNGVGKSTILEAILGVYEVVQARVAGRPQPASWPNHLRAPVTVGAKQGHIELEVSPSADEATLLRGQGINQGPGVAKLVLDASRNIVDITMDEVVSKLFAFHQPGDGYGYIDYIRPVRHYPGTGVGNLTELGTESRVRSVFAEFQRDHRDMGKFQDFKTYVVASTLNDATEYRETGQQSDSLGAFRRTFDRFFAPKRFIGPKRLSPGSAIELQVSTPFGTHDTDLLSDGEKEILNILAHLYQYRHLENAVLWDTPEANLNARLESRIVEALRQVAPGNQYLVASHGLELIESVDAESLFVLKMTDRGVTVDRFTGESRSRKVALFRELGARIGLQAVSSAVVFVEGKAASTDARQLYRLLSTELPSVTVIAAGDADSILGIGTRANRLLEEASTNGDFLALFDRDYRTDDQVAEIEAKYRGRVFVWRVHEFENLFLDPAVVYATLKELDRTITLHSADAVAEALRKSAEGLASWIAADWVRWDVHAQLVRPSGHIGFSDPSADLHDYFSRVRAMSVPLSGEEATNRLQQRVDDVARVLQTLLWRDRLPGKQILNRFLGDYAEGLESRQFIASAVSVVLRDGATIPELERLKDRIRDAVASETTRGTTRPS